MLNNRREQVLNYSPGEDVLEQKGRAAPALWDFSTPNNSQAWRATMKHTSGPSCQSCTFSLFWVTKRLKNNLPVTVFESLQEFRMSLKVKYSALQKAVQQGIFFSNAAKKKSYSLWYREEWNPYTEPLDNLQKFWANHTPECFPMPNTFNSQIWGFHFK